MKICLWSISLYFYNRKFWTVLNFWAGTSEKFTILHEFSESQTPQDIRGT